MIEEQLPNEDKPIVEVSEMVSPEDERVADLMAHTIDVSALATAVTKQKAADAADTLEDLDDVEAAEVIELMMVTDAVAFSTLLGFTWIALQWMQGN